MRRGTLALLLASIPVAAQVVGNTSPENLYERCSGSVVTILTFDSNRAPLGQGSGFIVAKNRIVTNYHVLAGSTSASIIFNDGSITLVADVTAASRPKDLLVVEAQTGNRPSLVLGNELKLKVGETIFVIGAPKGLAASLSSGLVSAFRQDEGQFLIQITAPIAPGSSGGPVLNNQGEVVGVATSQLKESGFGFAAGVGDVQHLLKVPLAVKIDLSDLVPEEAAASTGKPLSEVQDLLDKKQYDAAWSSFNSVPDAVRASVDGQLMLCKIEQERKEYGSAIDACDAASKFRPDLAAPYGLNAYSFLALGNSDRAEAAASKALSLSNEDQYKNLLGLIHYSQQKYQLASKELPTDSESTFLLTLAAGVAFHNRDFDSFRRLNAHLTSLKGSDNPWSLFTEGLAAEKELNWNGAIEKFKKCDADKDFIDPICQVAVAQTELRQGNLAASKSDIELTLSNFPKNHDVLSEAIFVNLLTGRPDEADRLHSVMKSTNPQPSDEFSDCLYYYGRNQAPLASGPCQAAIQANGSDYGAWSNAGYVALDNRDFRSALTYFAKALQLFSDPKAKRTVTQELDVCWGTLIAEYYSGDKKSAKALYREIKKDYPQFGSTAALRQLPLVWSTYTLQLIDTIMADLK